MRWWRYSIAVMAVWFAVGGAEASIGDSLCASLQIARADFAPARAACSALSAAQTDTTLSTYQYKLMRYQRFWRSLIPNQARLQYAGSVGMLNIGLGWHYGGRQHRLWETDFMVGYLPKHHSKDEHFTFTLRQSYIPFRKHLFWQIGYEPLATGLMLNTISGNEYWVREPSRYPHKYYGFSTALRLHVFVGQRLRFEVPSGRRRFVKAVSFCYELSTCDLYLASYVPNRYLCLRDILSLSFSIKVDAF